jgi:hypothetical protein
VNQFSNVTFLKVLFKWKFQLGAVVCVAVLLGVLFSSEWFIKPKYKSTAIIYPANLTPYGNETATEQMLQLLQSADIRTAICDRFNLAEKYKIDLAKRGGRSGLFDTYNENVDIRRTEFESVKIDVYDTDPLIASEMVDTIINLMNVKARSLQRAKTLEVVRLLKDELDYKRVQIDSLENALRFLREKFGLLDYYIQSKEALKRYYKIITSGSGSKDKLKELDIILKNLEEKGAESVSLKQMHQKTFETYSDIRVQYDKAVSDSRKVLTYANVVAKPYPADRKSTPVRWIVIVISALSSFIFALLLIIIYENKELFTKFQ